MTIGTGTLTHGLRVDLRGVLPWATLAAGGLVLLFWALYLSDAATLGQGDPLRATFEGAFPLADVVFAGALIATGVLFLRRHEAAPFVLVIAAAMSVYLGVLDVTFYAEHGLYTPVTADAATEILINVLCIGGGIYGLRAAWHLWSAR